MEICSFFFLERNSKTRFFDLTSCLRDACNLHAMEEILTINLHRLFSSRQFLNLINSSVAYFRFRNSHFFLPRRYLDLRRTHANSFYFFLFSHGPITRIFARGNSLNLDFFLCFQFNLSLRCLI